MIDKLIIGSKNIGKIKEFKELIMPLGIESISIIDKHIQEPEETGLTFVDNACLKASYYADAFGCSALADDSGLSIDALDGYPGVYSARVTGGDYNLAFSNIQRMLLEKGLYESKAHFVCVLALCMSEDFIEIFQGELHGKICFPPSGKNGFGYDPIFYPDGYNVSLAELSMEEKNKISHRAIALQKLIRFLGK